MEPEILDGFRRRSHLAAIVSGLGALIIVGAIGFAAVEVQRATHEREQLREKVGELEAQNAGALAMRDEALKEKAQAEADLARLQETIKAQHDTPPPPSPPAQSPVPSDNGTAPTPPDQSPVPSDDGTMPSQPPAPPPSETTPVDVAGRHAVTVMLYPRKFEIELDRAMQRTLDKLGFTVRLSRPTEDMGDLETNTVLFGADVKLSDIKLVALTLLDAGVKLRAIVPLPERGGAGRATIVVRAHKGAVNMPALTRDTVRDAETFGHQR